MDKEKVLELLEKADWKDIILKLTRYAYWQSQKYVWRRESKIDLPMGKTPQDLAYEAIKKVWDGTRDWDPNKYPDLLTHLKWIVKSDIGHLCNSIEHKKSVNINAKKENNNGLDNFDQLPSSPNSQLQGHVISPEENIVNKENAERFNRIKSKLYKIVDDDEDLQLLLYCLEEGIEKSEDIAQETGWEISKVYNLKRKLMRRASKIKNVLFGEKLYDG
jgi:hypothetical protein